MGDVDEVKLNVYDNQSKKYVIVDTEGLSNDLEALKKEISKRIDIKKNELGEKIFSCTECRKEFKKMEKAKLHVEIHVSGFYHSCDACGATTKSRNSLNQHKYTKHTKMGTNK